MERAPGVVEKVAALLRALSAAESGTTTTALAAATAQPRATTHRLLASLAAEGLADRDAQTGRWFLGPEAYVLGRAAAARYDLTHEARTSVHRLAKETGESAFFSVRRGDEVVVLLREDGDFPIRSHVLYESARFPLAAVSGGLAILAHLSPRELDAYFERNDLVAAWGRQHAESAVRRRLAAARRTGWSVNPGLVVEGSWGMAAAVFDKAGRPEWALTLTGVDHRFRPDRQPVLGRLLLEEAHRLSRLA